MPLTGKDKKVERNFEEEYPGRGKDVFYASINSGRVTNIPEAERMKKRQARSHKRSKRRNRR
jgi:hypothetical protein